MVRGSFPLLEIHLARLEHNSRVIVERCAAQGAKVIGVTKGCLGMPAVARAMLAGGVAGIGESRLANIRRLREAGIRAEITLLRIPMISEVSQVVELVDVSANSELSVVRALAEEASRRGLVHKVLVMVDVGDLREGLWPDDVLPFVREVAALEGIEVVGLGTNLACYGGVKPSRENMGLLLELAERVRAEVGLPCPVVSGLNSAGLNMIFAGRVPPGINQCRIGEGFLLGTESTQREPLPGLYQDCFRLVAEVIEVKDKPSVPIGDIGLDAFGNAPRFEDRGWRKRALVALGRQDVPPEGIIPLVPGVEVLGASSDHTVLDVTDCEVPVRVGDTLSFGVRYSALLGAMTSPFVEKRVIGQ